MWTLRCPCPMTQPQAMGDEVGTEGPIEQGPVEQGQDGSRQSPDQSLVGALVRGESGASDQLVAGHADAVFEFILYRVGRQREVAEDLAQETLLTALDRIHRFDGRSSLRTWLLGIAKNKVRESFRARRARPLSEILIDSDDEVLGHLARIESEPLPEEALEREETRAFVGATLASLPEAYRTALTEHYIEGRSVPETARAHGRGVKAAESTLHRARRAFRDTFSALVGHAARGDHSGGTP